MIRTLGVMAVVALTSTAAFAQTAPAPTEPATPAAPAAPAAPAQTMTPEEAGAMAYESARNQLGVLEYCQSEGHIDGKAVEIQTKLLTLIPEGDKAKGDAAEEKGKKGTVSAMGVEQSLAEAAKAQNAEVSALCKQMDQMIQQLAAQLPQ